MALEPADPPVAVCVSGPLLRYRPLGRKGRYT